MKFPDFIIIGVIRGGTTSLWYNLNKHPKIKIPGPKKPTNDPNIVGPTEMHFWGSQNWKKGIDWYKSHFKDGFINGDKTGAYCYRNKSMKLMKEYIPDVKLIMILRNPVDRSYSNFQMDLRRKRVTKFNIKRYSGASLYYKHIKNRVLEYFPRESLYICISERMRKNTNEEINKIYNFLGAEQYNLNNKEVSHEKGHIKGRLISTVSNQNFYKSWQVKYDPLPIKTRKKALEFFKPSNEKLFEFLGYEIEEWSK